MVGTSWLPRSLLGALVAVTLTSTVAIESAHAAPPAGLAITSVQAVEDGVLVQWTTPLSLPVTTWVVTAQPGNVVSEVGAQFRAVAFFDGLQSSTDYTFTVFARTAQGNSEPSAPFHFTTPEWPPAPTNVHAAVDPSPSGNLLVTWTAPPPRVDPILGYSIWVRGNGQLVRYRQTGTATSFRPGGIVAGKAYEFRVAAFYNSGIATSRYSPWTPALTVPASSDVFAVNVRVNEGNKARIVAVTISLPAPRATDITVKWKTVSGTALDRGRNLDYGRRYGRVTVPGGSTSVQVPIRIRGDRTPEVDETFTIEIEGGKSGIITIADDD